jgi:hypothetical protein
MRSRGTVVGPIEAHPTVASARNARPDRLTMDNGATMNSQESCLLTLRSRSLSSPSTRCRLSGVGYPSGSTRDDLFNIHQW